MHPQGPTVYEPRGERRVKVTRHPDLDLRPDESGEEGHRRTALHHNRDPVSGYQMAWFGEEGLPPEAVRLQARACGQRLQLFHLPGDLSRYRRWTRFLSKVEPPHFLYISILNRYSPSLKKQPGNRFCYSYLNHHTHSYKDNSRAKCCSFIPSCF